MSPFPDIQDPYVSPVGRPCNQLQAGVVGIHQATKI
jgi:hypothetical protein